MVNSAIFLFFEFSLKEKCHMMKEKEVVLEMGVEWKPKDTTRFNQSKARLQM